MYFFVDESGHTGVNLFDQNQPNLYYGVLSSPYDLDISTANHLQVARAKLGVERLHASELGFGGLIKIVDILLKLQSENTICFDICFVCKPDYALITFFDQVFDQGVNPAASWTGYWTPLRYMLLLKLSSLFDEGDLKLAWKARIETNDEKSNEYLRIVCKTIYERAAHMPDKRASQLIRDAVAWAEKNPDKIFYNCNSNQSILSVSPNLIGFQNVMFGIAQRISDPDGASSIVIDQQTQFNKAQKTLAEYYASARDVSLIIGPGLPKMDLKNIPNVPIKFCSSADSPGLELVDIYLWIFKRFLEGKPLAAELMPLIEAQAEIGMIDGISLNAIDKRWSKPLLNLPDVPENQMEKVIEMLAIDETRRLKALKDLS